MYIPIIFISLIVLVSVTRPFTVLFHELGHAIPAILLTKKKVTIYIGSYGDPSKSLKINIGYLEAFFRFNPLAWRLGLCVPSENSISLNKQIIYIIAGPITSLLVAAVACYTAFAFDMHGILKLLLIVFLGSSIFDLFINLIPISDPIVLFDGTVTYNDGYHLKKLFYYKRLAKEYKDATEFYKKQQYPDAAKLLDKILSNGLKDENIYRLAINSYLQDKNYIRAKELSEEFSQLDKMNSEDLAYSALSYSQLGFHDKAIELYDKSLQLDPENRYSLNNKGYTLNLLNRYQEAIPYFDKAIKLENTFAYSYNNRGLSKIKIGLVDEGLKDIKYSLELDKNNSYGYRNLGIYYFDKGEYQNALELFIKTKNLDSSTHLIDELIIETEQRLNA